MAPGREQATVASGAAPGTRPAPARPAVPDPAAAGRRPWWVWAVPVAALFTLLCLRNLFLFSERLYEQGDGGANSILITQAMHFTLLIGNYSRERFNHPGPAYMYVQAWGQYLFQDWLHLVPTAWNAHMLSVFALDAGWVALCVGIVWGWTRSLWGAAACLAVVIAFAVAYPPVVNSDWMPYMYVPTYVVFLLACASVVAGRKQDAWIFALSGWFLIHGQACFLFFVPFLTLAVLAALWWPRRHRMRAALGSFLRHERRIWVPVAVISAVFAFPILLNLALHWPGDFGKYISYGESKRAGGHSFRQIVDYALWFWWPHRYALLAPVLLYAAALAVTFRLARGPLQRFLLTALGVNIVSSVAFGIYVAVGVDDLSAYYIGYFYWSAPLITVLVIVLALISALPPRLTGVPVKDAAAVLAAVAAFAALAVIPGARTSTNDIDEALPHVVAALAARSGGKTIVLHIDHPAWVETTGFLDQAERTGVSACLDDPWFTFLVTKQFICTPAQVADGSAYWFYTPAGLPRGTPVLLRFSGIDVAPASSP